MGDLRGQVRGAGEAELHPDPLVLGLEDLADLLEGSRQRRGGVDGQRPRLALGPAGARPERGQRDESQRGGEQ